MWKIANTKIDSKVVLAPMAGISSYGYRHFMKQFGVGLVVTEMISDCGLIYKNQETLTYLKTSKNERPLAIQLFGGNKDTLSEAIKIVENTTDEYDFIDVNLGCPVFKVTKTNAGSAWLKNPKAIGEMMKKLVETSKKPVTAKIRLGWDMDSINYIEVIKELELAGVSMIAIHARTRSELYSGQPHFDLLKDLQDKMSVPLVVSGNIYTLDDAIHAIELTKASGIMIARGGVGNPRLISQINEYYKSGKRLPDATIEEQIEYCIELADFLIKEKGEAKAMLIYRGIAPKFFSGFTKAKQFKTKLTENLRTYNDLLDILKEMKDYFALEKVQYI